MEADEPGRLRALREALYRPGASAEDREAYAAMTHVDAQPDAPAAHRGRRRRARTVVLMATVCLVGAVALLAVLRSADPGRPAVASTPIALTGSAADRAGTEADLAALFNQRHPFLGLFLASHRTALSASLRSDSIAIDGRGTGPTTVPLVGLLSDPGQATGLLTVLLACDRPGTAYSWVLEGPPDSIGRPVRTRASGADCGSGIVTSTFVPRPHHVPTRIRIDVPDGVRSLVEVDLSTY